LLEAMGHFVGSPGDKFSLISVYSAAILRDVCAHYTTLASMKKTADTANPNYPKRKQRRRALSTRYVGVGTPMTPSEIAAIRELGDVYFQGRENPEDKAHLVDPLVTDEDRAARELGLQGLRPMTLAEEYVAHRRLTKSLI